MSNSLPCPFFSFFLIVNDINLETCLNLKIKEKPNPEFLELFSRLVKFLSNSNSWLKNTSTH